MKTTSLWIIKLALTVQFLGVLAVPALVASNGAPRATWMAEWVNAGQEPALSEGRTSPGEVRPESNGRTIGVLKLRDGKLTFTEQIGLVDWEIDLASVRRVAPQSPSTSLRASGAVVITTMAGQEFVVGIMDSNLTQMSPKRVASAIDRAIQFLTTNSR